MIDSFNALWDRTRPAFIQERSWHRCRTLSLGALLGLGRNTVSGMLMASGQQFVDWSAAYRLFNRERIDLQALMAPARREVIARLDPHEPLVALLDDTLLRKRGRKIAGTSYRRDPLGPPFRVNFVWAQRFLQVSAALPESGGPSRARAIPIDLVHCPSPRKPRRDASDESWEQYNRDRESSRISLRGAEAIARLRDAMDDEGQHDRPLVVAVDGSYTNTTVIKTLPERTTLIGRVRKDAKLFRPPNEHGPSGRGRKRVYGDPLPTPDQVRQDDSIRWQKVKAHGAGRTHDFHVKRIGPVRWRGAGARDLQLIVIRPLAYRPSKNSKVLYRQPSFLLCSDVSMPIEKIVQSYLWRWEIEVNFRDQKTALGTGQAQVRKKEAVQGVPVMIAAAYSFLLLALEEDGKKPSNRSLPKPKWQREKKKEDRLSIAQGINLLRTQMWGRALGIEHLTDFDNTRTDKTKSPKLHPGLDNPANAVLYAHH